MTFDKHLPIKTDHLSLLSLSLGTAASIFFDLGFVRGGGRTALDQKVMEMTAPTIRFVFDNAYIECVQFPPEISEYYTLLSTPAGIHIMALLTTNAETTLERLQERGMDVDELERVVRQNVDYGEKQGAVIFDMAPLPEEIIPRTHIAFLEHKTHELMYQPTRCAHINEVTRLERAVLCCADEATADHIVAELTDLAKLAENEKCVGGMESLRLMDPESFAQEYGFTPDPTGSCFTALEFGTPNMEATLRYLNYSGYPLQQMDGRVRVWPPKRLGLVIDFVSI